jgi:hypothetical protein
LLLASPAITTLDKEEKARLTVIEVARRCVIGDHCPSGGAEGRNVTTTPEVGCVLLKEGDGCDATAQMRKEEWLICDKRLG